MPMSAIDELKGLRRNGNMFKSALIFFAGLGFWATEAQAAKRYQFSDQDRRWRMAELETFSRRVPLLVA
jgi:hypothetical protein